MDRLASGDSALVVLTIVVGVQRFMCPGIVAAAKGDVKSNRAEVP
jgi:hypothetical protein